MKWTPSLFAHRAVIRQRSLTAVPVASRQVSLAGLVRNRWRQERSVTRSEALQKSLRSEQQLISRTLKKPFRCNVVAVLRCQVQSAAFFTSIFTTTLP